LYPIQPPVPASIRCWRQNDLRWPAVLRHPERKFMPIQPMVKHAPVQRRRRVVPRASFSTVGQCFDIEVSRDASGWEIRVPEIAATTHVQRRAEVSIAARECIAANTGIPIGYIAVIVRD
jgi:hypothetical protein